MRRRAGAASREAGGDPDRHGTRDRWLPADRGRPGAATASRHATRPSGGWRGRIRRWPWPGTTRPRHPAVRTLLDRDAELLEEPPAVGCDITDRGLERLGVARGRGPIAAQLADELKGGRLDLTRGGRFGTAELLDASAHDATVGLMSRPRQRLVRFALAVVAGLLLAVASDVLRVGGSGLCGAPRPAAAIPPAGRTDHGRRGRLLSRLSGRGCPDRRARGGSGRRRRLVERGARRDRGHDPDLRLRSGRARLQRPTWR